MNPNEYKLGHISTGKFTGRNKIPDLLDFYIAKGITENRLIIILILIIILK